MASPPPLSSSAATLPVSDSSTVLRPSSSSTSLPPPQQLPTPLDTGKISIILRATPGTPIISKAKWTVDGSHDIAWLLTFLHKALKLDPAESLFVYVNQSFAPSLDHRLSSLHACFAGVAPKDAQQPGAKDPSLVLYYSRTSAWG